MRSTWTWILSFVLEESSIRCATGFVVVCGCLVAFSLAPIAGGRFKLVTTLIVCYALQECLIKMVCEVGPWLAVVVGLPFVSTLIMDSQIHHAVLTATSSDGLQQQGIKWKRWNWFLWVVQVVATIIFVVHTTKGI